MPFLRFTRDKRGYETTSLVHAPRGQGRSKQRLLYWFRTPPGVKVGRPALDEDAIRWIEEQNPDIQFDWQKILEAQPPPPQPPDDSKSRRQRSDRTERRRGADRRPEEPRQAEFQPTDEEESVLTAEAEIGTAAPEEDRERDVGAGDSETEIAADALEQITHPDVEETVEPAGPPVDHALDAEQLLRLRGRYAEIQRRITERGGERVDELRLQAESLNPDGWVTQEEVRKGLEEFESRIGRLRSALGLRRRRRSRRGGRRSKPEQAPDGQ